MATCTVLVPDANNKLKEYNGIVHFYNDALNIIPDDENYPETKYWVGKRGSLNTKIGIVSMNINFEIQETKPFYKDLSSDEILVPPVGGDTTITDGGDNDDGQIKEIAP